MTQPCLPECGPHTPQHIRKKQRQVCKETFNVLQDAGALSAGCTKVMRGLKAFMNEEQYAPTTAEFTEWLWKRGILRRNAPNLISGRITEMSGGRTRRLKDGTQIREERREIEFLPVRICRVTGRPAHPIRPREKGSAEPR